MAVVLIIIVIISFLFALASINDELTKQDIENMGDSPRVG